MKAQNAKQLAGLQKLTALVLAASQSKMRAIREEEDRLRDQIADLDRAVRSRHSDLVQAPDAAVMAGVDMRWHLWIEQRRAALLSELARTRARREGLRDALVKDFGRDRAVSNLLDTALAEASIKPSRASKDGH